MRRLNIAAKIWLAIGIFVLGFVFSTGLDQVQGRNTEARLKNTSEALFPAALQSREAEAAFRRMRNGFSDAVVAQDRSALDTATRDGQHVLKCLRTVAAIPGLPATSTSEARRLASEVRRFLGDALASYPAVVARPKDLTPEAQQQLRQMAVRTDSLEVALAQLEDRFSSDLRQNLRVLEARSQRERWLGLIVFFATLGISAVLVSLTIRHVITIPLMRAEAELAHERDLLRILLDNIPDSIYFKDVDGKYLRVNKAQSEFLGIEDERQAVGRSEFDFLDREFAEQSYQDEREILRTGDPLVSTLARVNSLGSTRWLTSTKVPVKEVDGRVSGIVCVSRDTTEWKEVMESLQKSEESFRLLFAAIPHAVWVYDVATLEFLEVNEAATRHYGYSADEFRDLRVSAIHPPEEDARLRRALASAEPAKALSGSWKHQTKSGQTLEVEVGAHVFLFRDRRAVMAVVQDVTERNRLAAELHQAQRLESVGQLAAGIAHEINTPIQYVGDNIRFLRDSLQAQQKVLTEYDKLREAAVAGAVTPALLSVLATALEEADTDYLNEETPKAIAESLDGVERVATIVRAMKEFAHPGRKEKAATDLNRALSNTLIVARNELKYVADVETDFGELPPVVCQLAEINQVFLNLLINAAQAIAEVATEGSGKGRITVRTRLAGPQVVIAISDTGCGIPAHIQSKVFDPFFTTKPVGKGTGQGLAIARSIVVEKHGGSLTFEPNGSRGTTFLVTLPVEPEPAVVGEESKPDSLCGSSRP